jgi:hypothetical protein
MADDKLATEREHDKKILIGIVKDIGDQLKIIVFQRRDLFRSEFRRYFPGPWDEIEQRLARATVALNRDDFNWEYVEGAGLVRDSLQFKRNILTEAIKQGVVARLLKIINSILGSLTGVFPFLEAVKEYKEQVEAAIAIQNRWE